MKLIISLALLCISTLSQAALFDFSTRAVTPAAPDQAGTWAVDLATARQWYIVWAASADRVYQNLINPGVNIATKTSARVNTETLLSRVVLLGVLALFAAALVSALKSISKVVLLSRARTAN